MQFLLFIAAFMMLAFSPPSAHAEGEQRTLSIIKPDAVAAHHIGEIIARFEKNGLRIAAMKMVRLTPDEAKSFYFVHKQRSFFSELVAYMSSGPIVALVL